MTFKFRHAEKTISVLDLNIKFKPSSDSWGEKICGRLNVFEANVDNESYQGSDDNDKEIKNSFIDHKGMIEVKIVLGNKTIESSEELKFEIVFTSFQGMIFLI